MLHRLVFFILFCISITPSTFARKEMGKFHKKMMEDIERTKGNEHIYREGRVPASAGPIEEFNEAEEEARFEKKEEWEEPHQENLLRRQNMYQDPNGPSDW
jgi:hypothetical protein